MGLLSRLFGLSPKGPTITVAGGLNAQRGSKAKGKSGFYTKIRGVSLRQRDVAKCKAGEMLQLRREPNNPADPNAIAVFSSRGKMLGYIGRDCAKDLAKDIDAGRKLSAVVSQITGEDKDILGCNIRIEFLD